MRAKIVLLLLLSILGFEIALSLAGPGGGGRYLYLAKVYTFNVNLFCLPFTAFVLIKAFLLERDWKDKAFWGSFIFITQVVGATFYLIWRRPGQAVQQTAL